MPNFDINTKVSLGPNYGRGLPNLTLEDAKFFGRPNFIGAMDDFGDDRRKFTVLIPNDIADQLRELGYNVKTTLPKPAYLEQNPDAEERSHLKVFLNFGYAKGHEGDDNYETGPKIYIKQGDVVEKLTSKTVGVMDRLTIDELDMEIRAWEFNPKEKPGQYSARLVELVAVVRPSILGNKYGRLE